MQNMTTIRNNDGWFEILHNGEIIGLESSLEDARWIASNARDTCRTLTMLTIERAQATAYVTPNRTHPDAHSYLTDEDGPQKVGFWEVIGSGGRKRQIVGC